MIEERRARGENPYPHKWDVTTSLTEFITKYKPLLEEQNGRVLEEVNVRVAGFYIFFAIFSLKSRSTSNLFLEENLLKIGN
jgi:hypothetical protein